MWTIEEIVGCIAISCFSLCYYTSTIYFISTLLLLFFYPYSFWTWLFALPLFISAALPPRPCFKLFDNFFFKSVLKYHKFEAIDEASDEELAKLGRNYIFAVTPHGVLSVCGISFCINRAPNPIPPTAVAGVLLRIPILKHFFGAMHITDASSRNLVKVLKKSPVVLYVGGIAELFLSSPTVEKLYIKKRQSFVKLALQNNVDIVPAYFFGNTSAMQIAQHPILAWISRKVGVSLTTMWGLWGLPIPLPKKLIAVRGKPLGIPHIENPTQEDIDKWHGVYVEEVIRLYNTYKKLIPDYANKPLEIT